MALNMPTRKPTSAKDILAAGKGPLAMSGGKGGLTLAPSKPKTVTSSGDKGFSLMGGTDTKGSAGGDKGFQLSGTATSAVPSGQTAPPKYSDGAGQTDWSKLIREELAKGSAADAGLLQGYLDARNQKITSDPSIAVYANDDIAKAARERIAVLTKPQYQEWDESPYTAAKEAQDAYLKAQLKQTVAGLEAQKGSVTDSAEEAARQAYISYMQSRNTLPQALAASGYAGGMADSQRLALDTNLQNSQQAILKSRDSALNEIDAAVNNARLESSVQGAQAQVDLARDAIAAYQNFINQQNAYANQDFWTRYGYDFQAAKDAIDRDFQTKTLLQQQQWQERQGKDEAEDANQTTAQKQAYESAWNLISAGVMPSMETLTLAGINQADAQAYVAYIKSKLLSAQKKQQTQSVYQSDKVSENSPLNPYETKQIDESIDESTTGLSRGEYIGIYNRVNDLFRSGSGETAFQLMANNWGRLSQAQKGEIKKLFLTRGYELGEE